MGAATVRAAIQDWLEGGQITGLQRVYKAPPWWIDGGTFDVAAELGWGAVAAINLDDQDESRATLPAITGQKRVSYKVGVLLIVQYLIPNPLPPGQSEDAWVDPVDQLVDDVADRIRQDPTLGAPDVIFEAGQLPDGISISRDIPKRDPRGGKIHIWHLLQFGLAEIITA